MNSNEAELFNCMKYCTCMKYANKHTFIESHFVALHPVGGHGQQVATLPGNFIDEVTVTG